MKKQYCITIAVLFAVSLVILASGCDLTGNANGSGGEDDDGGESTDIDVVFQSTQQTGGTSGAADSTGLTLSFDVDPTTLTADDVTVTGATKGALSGSGTTRSLAISDIAVCDGNTVSVAVESPSGQTTSYRTGDDGDLEKGVAWPDPRFANNGDETITDSVTGLMWQRVPLSTTRTWDDAIGYCNALGLASYDDWRLPNLLELESLYNAEESTNDTWLNGQGFSGVEGSNYWSAGTYAFDTGRAWSMHMRFGRIYPENGSSEYYAIAVRDSGQSGVIDLPKTGQTTSYRTGDDGHFQKGMAWPDPRFTDSGTGTITDNLTGLMWQRVPLGTAGDWDDAIDYCNALDLSGYTDWRLPNRKELMSLVNYGEDNNATWLNGQGFSDVEVDIYWSAGTYAIGTSNAWSMRMRYGNIPEDGKVDSNYVLAVRGG